MISTNTLTIIVDDIANALNNIPSSVVASIKVGTTQVQNGTNTYILFNNGGILGNEQTVPVVNGGTGQASLTAHAVLLGAGTGNVGFVTIGTSGRLLIDQGAGADPLFNAMSGDATITNTGAITVTKTGGVPLRIPLTTATTFYVATTGSDSNNGLTSGTPWLTPQHAYAVLTSLYDFGGQNVTVQFANGTYTYTGFQLTNPWTGGGTLTFQGDTTTPDNVVINVTGSGTNACGFINLTTLPGFLGIYGMKITVAVGGQACIRNAGLGTIQFKNIDFGACAQGHVEAASVGTTIQAIGNYSIIGNAAFHLFGNGGGLVQARAVTVTLTGTPAFSGAFARANDLGSVQANNTSFSGSATGSRYMAMSNGVILTGGGGANFFPGDADGTISSGGQYA